MACLSYFPFSSPPIAVPSLERIDGLGSWPYRYFFPFPGTISIFSSVCVVEIPLIPRILLFLPAFLSSPFSPAFIRIRKGHRSFKSNLIARRTAYNLRGIFFPRSILASGHLPFAPFSLGNDWMDTTQLLFFREILPPDTACKRLFPFDSSLPPDQSNKRTSPYFKRGNPPRRISPPIVFLPVFETTPTQLLLLARPLR